MSVLAWVDFGQQHREDMDRLLDAFRDESTVDELGIGTIRDTFAEMLFPGTSTLHTRARYLLFVAWQVSTVAAQRHHLERALTELRSAEVRLIEALLRGEPDGGVLGKVARAALKRMPSEVYWSATGRYGIRRCDEGIQQHFRSVTSSPTLPIDEEDGALHRHSDPHFGALPPPPDDLYDVTTFDLTPDEAEFLSDRILATCPDTYLEWLVRHRTPGTASYAWDEALSTGLEGSPARALAHARRLHHLYEGAPLLYNLLLARLADWDEAVELYTARLDAWGSSEGVATAVAEWDREDFWRCVLDHRGRIHVGTRDFVDRWVNLVLEDPGGAWRSPEAAELVRTRERKLKGVRSRFVNRDVLASWRGGSGVGGLQYRWPNTRTLVNDIRRAQGLPDA